MDKVFNQLQWDWIKGGNRFFWKYFNRNIKSIKEISDMSVERTHGRIYLRVGANTNEAIERLSKVLG